MKSLYNIVEGVGHVKNRLGVGSSGVTYRIDGDKVRKTLRLDSRHNNLAHEKKIIERWSKIKKGLTVIPYIYDVDYDGYTMDLFTSPCPEGEIIEEVLFKCLFSPERRHWDDEKIDKASRLVGDDNTRWVMSWLDDYCHDYKLITGNDKICDDIRSANIGKTKDGRVVCFDWFDPYSS